MKEGNKENNWWRIEELIFIIFFIIFTIIIVYFLSKGGESSQIKLEVTGVYKDDQANAIKAVADATTNRVNNIIATTAIFFTVIVASMSIFQIIKTKQVDSFIESTERKMNEKVGNIEEKLRLSNVENKIFIKIIRIIDLEKDNNVSSNRNIIRFGEEILTLLKENSDFKLEERQLNGIYFALGKAYRDFDIRLSIKHLEESLKYQGENSKQYLAILELASIYYIEEGDKNKALNLVDKALKINEFEVKKLLNSSEEWKTFHRNLTKNDVKAHNN